MIEMLVAKNGKLIFDVDHRQIASHYDPVTEANLWVERRLQEASKAKSLVVLGLGCGYHILELGKRLPNSLICVIETKQEVIDSCQKIHGLDFPQFNVRLITSVHELKQTSWLDQAIFSSYRVLVHQPSYHGHETLYGELYRFLIGRTWSSLTWHWHKRFGDHLVQRLQAVSLEDSELLSIKSLDATIDQSPLRGKSKSWMVFKALRELVK